MTDAAWRELSSEVLVNSPWLRVSKHQFEQPSGVVIPEYYITHTRDAGLTVTVADGAFVLVRQYRPGIGKETLCHPGGRIESLDVDSRSGAVRELLEETGLSPTRVRSLGCFGQIPAVSSGRVHIFLAETGQPADAPTPDAYEDLSIERVAIGDSMAVIEDGRMDCVACVAATVLALRVLNQ